MSKLKHLIRFKKNGEIRYFTTAPNVSLKGGTPHPSMGSLFSKPNADWLVENNNMYYDDMEVVSFKESRILQIMDM